MTNVVLDQLHPMQWAATNPYSSFYSTPLYTNAPSLQALEPTVTTKSKKGQKYNKNLQDVFAGVTSHKPTKYSGKIGLEIECEGLSLFNSPITYWNCHADGSLRPYQGHPPIEYVLNKPLGRNDLELALDYLASRLVSARSKVVESPRTSVHVHLNQQNKSMKKVLTLLCVYLIVEDLLVHWSGPSRVGNMFCLRARDAEHFITMLESAIASDEYAALCNNEMRYTSCNLASLMKFGSLEFRTLEGTVDKNRILLWVDILLELEKTSEQFTCPQHVVTTVEKLIVTQGAGEVVRKLLPKYYQEIVPYPNLKDTIWKALRRVKDVAYAIPVWEETKEVGQMGIIPDLTPEGFEEEFFHDEQEEYLGDE